MKPITLALFAISAMATAHSAHALVADAFHCSISFNDYATKTESSQEKDFYIARLPLSASPSPDVRVTAGQSSETLIFGTPAGTYTGSVNFSYRQAVRLDMHGRVVEARQTTCFVPYGGFCPKPAEGDPMVCGIAMGLCSEPAAPFDPRFGWAEVPLYGNTPAFSDKALAPYFQEISSGGKAIGRFDVSCRYKGTYE